MCVCHWGVCEIFFLDGWLILLFPVGPIVFILFQVVAPLDDSWENQVVISCNEPRLRLPFPSARFLVKALGAVTSRPRPQKSRAGSFLKGNLWGFGDEGNIISLFLNEKCSKLKHI